MVFGLGVVLLSHNNSLDILVYL